MRADLADSGSVAAIVDETVEKLGGIDILVNNAGIIRRAPLTEFTEKDWDDVMNVNTGPSSSSARPSPRS